MTRKITLSHKLQLKWEIARMDIIYYLFGVGFTIREYVFEGLNSGFTIMMFVIGLEIVTRHIEYKLYMRKTVNDT